MAAAKTLCSRGHRVTLFEQFELFHDRGSSHGESRIVRRAYPDAFYTACMAEAYPLWAELEAESGRHLVTECGLLYFGGRDAPKIRAVVSALEDLQVPFDLRDASSVTDLLPELRLRSDEVAVWTPEAGWVNAAAALRALYDVATARGLETQAPSTAVPLELAEKFDAVIVAAGAWTPRFAPVPVTVTMQTFCYVRSQIGGPVWIEDSADELYGTPATASGQKIGVHHAGPVIDPSSDERRPDPGALELIRECSRERFGIAEPELSGAKTCLYTSTSNSDFLLGRLAPNVFFASACSGHGFKLGPWIGKLLADFAEGKDSPERHPRFLWPQVS